MTTIVRKYSQLLRHPVVQNAIGLYAVQFATILLPVVLVPYLARVLRPAGWGAVVFAQAFAVWLQLIIDFGFNFSASREIARCRADAAQVNHIVTGVMGAKALLFLVAVLFMVVSLYTVPVFSTEPLYAPLALLIALTQSLYPVWYFQGQERLRRPAMISVVIRLLMAGVTVVLVRSPEDGWLVLALQAIGAAITASITLWWMYQEVPFLFPSWHLAREAIFMGRSMFLFSAASSMYNSANSFILGLFVTPTVVGFYGGAERIHRLGISPFGPLSAAFYPHMIRSVMNSVNQARVLARRILILFSIVGVILAVIVYWGAPLWVSLLLGPGYESSTPILRIFAMQIPLTAISRIIGFQWLLPRNKDFVFNTIVILGAITNLVLAFWWIPVFGAVGMVSSFVVSELLVTTAMLVVAQRNDRLLWGR